MAATITDLLNALNRQSFFSYVIPFLLIFAVVYAILERSRLFAIVKKATVRDKDGVITDQGEFESNKSISAVIAVAVALLALQFDMVSIFFANIFPKFGVGLAVFLVLVIALGFFYPNENDGKSPMRWIGWLVGIGVVLWAISNWGTINSDAFSLGYFFEEYFWAFIVLLAVVGTVIGVAKSSK
jgi:hypothetical protein